MIILSHRGYWKTPIEKNTEEAFLRSFQLGFGTETDLRDFEQQIVISHDPATKDNQHLEDFLKTYLKANSKLPLALNIKADGLQLKLKQILEDHQIENYFVFDMAIPDALGYLKLGMNVFTRQSEYETVPSFYTQAVGIWLDEFHEHWIDENIISRHLKAGKQICIVSPELHNRTFEKEWNHYREIEQRLGIDNLMLCTDLPEYAKTFFDHE